MPFGLKNFRATYERLVDHIFKDMMSITIKVYFDDIIIKSKRKEDHLMRLQ